MSFYSCVKRLKVLLLIVNISLILALITPQSVYAQADSSISKRASFTLKDLGHKTDDEYQGILVSRQYDVNIPLNWEISQSAKITIYFSHSPSLNNHSSIAVDWNGTRISSTLLDKTNTEDGSLVIEVPADSLVSGFNQLNIQFYMGIRDDFCEDFDNPAVWAVVHNTSSFELNYAIQSPEINLYGLPERLIDPSPIAQNEITIVLPQTPNPAELNAAALVSAKLGQFADWRNLNLNTITLESVDGETKGNLIFIGLASHLVDRNASLVPASSGSGEALILENEKGSAIASDSGVLWLQGSSNDPGAIWLSVTGMDETGLKKAAGAFATTSLFQRFSGPLAIILDVPALSESVNPSPSLTYTLSDLGYTDIVSIGNRQQSAFLTIPVQMVFDSLGEATFILNYSHSKVLNPERSSMDILLNSVPVSSIKLSESNADNAQEILKIPLRLFKMGENTLTIVSNIQVNTSTVDSTLYCTDDYYSDSWLTINSTSTLSFPTGIGQHSASLTGYPALYLGSASLSNLAFVVPDDMDWSVASGVVTIANRLGRISEGDAINLAVVGASDQSSIESERPYQILIGFPEQNPAIMALNEILPQPFDTESFLPKPLDGVATVLSSDSLGIIESLFTEKGDYRLVVTATSAEGYLWAVEAMDNPAVYQQFNGNLVIFSGDEELAFYTLASSTSLVTDQTIQITPIVETETGQHPNWVIILALTVLIVSIGVVFITRFVRKS
jgi:cellulose synthase operon protein B